VIHLEVVEVTGQDPLIVLDTAFIDPQLGTQRQPWATVGKGPDRMLVAVTRRLACPRSKFV
jgi:hypothetical protein